jgi:hypothetical protein
MAWLMKGTMDIKAMGSEGIFFQSRAPSRSFLAPDMRMSKAIPSCKRGNGVRLGVGDEASCCLEPGLGSKGALSEETAS